MKLTIECDVEIVEEISNDAIARVYYPGEGNKIVVKKGLNAIEFSEAIHHEIGHLFDWYLGDGKQSASKDTREKSAIAVGESLRWKESSQSS